jgi:hypothetical protein
MATAEIIWHLSLAIEQELGYSWPRGALVPLQEKILSIVE